MIKQKKSFVSEDYVNLVSIIIILIAIIIILVASFIANQKAKELPIKTESINNIQTYSQESINYDSEESKEVKCSLKEKTNIVCNT